MTSKIKAILALAPNADVTEYNNVITWNDGNPNNITEEHKISYLKKELNDQCEKYYSLVDEFELLKGDCISLSSNLQISRNQNMKLRKINYDLCNKKTLLETELRNYRFKNYYLRDMIDEMKSNLLLRKNNKIL